jgi:hypothetical protein
MEKTGAGRKSTSFFEEGQVKNLRRRRKCCLFLLPGCVTDHPVDPELISEHSKIISPERYIHRLKPIDKS